MLRHRVQRPGDFHVIVTVHLDPGEDRPVVGLWQRQQIAGLHGWLGVNDALNAALAATLQARG